MTLKTSNPGKWYKLVKQIGANNDQFDPTEIESLKGLTPEAAAEKIADFFAQTSNEYSPVNTSTLPSYLPALPPPQLNEIQVYNKLAKLKKTKSTHPIDIPCKLRKEVAPFLASPLTDILNQCLKSQIYPTLWKVEMITPINKVNSPTKLTELRKIAGTSDYNKLF